MAEDFKRGTFRQYRATTKVNFGSLERELPNGIPADSVIEFDGHTFRFEGEEFQVPQVRGCIKVGWFVPVEDTESAYRPQSSARSISPAATADKSRPGKVMPVQTVMDEERDVGDLTSSRAARASAQAQAEAQLVGRRKAGSMEDGVPVARLRTPAKSGPIKVDAENASRIAQEVARLDKAPPPKAEPIRTVATGDVEEPIVSDVLDDLLPDAATSAVPAPGPAGEGQDPHLTREEQEAHTAKAEAAERAEAERQRRQTQANKKVAGKKADKTVADSGDSIDFGKLALVRAAIPDFTWDMTRPRQQRVEEAVSRFAADPLRLGGILAVEVDAVKVQIQGQIAGT